MPSQDLVVSRKRSKRQSSRRNDDRPAEHSGYLPLDIVEIILTYLPINLAVQSALVGKRFKDVWMFSRRLEFGRDLAMRFSTFDYFTIVNTILCLHQGPKIQSFSMYLDPTGYEAQVRHWIEIVMSKGVEELDLDFFGTWNHRKFPLGPLDLPLVRVLKLSLCDFPLHQSPDSLRRLRTLVLKNVNINVKIIETVLKNCKLLETLEIIYCRIIGPIRVVAHDLKRFMTLKIYDCPDICHLEIDSPTLRSLHFRGRVPLLIFGDMSRLYDAILNVKPHPGLLIPSHLIKRLIRDFAYIRVLTLNGAFLEGLTSTYFDLLRGKKTAHSFSCLVELQIFVDGSLICNPYDIISFIVRCPNLERLFIDLKESSLEGSIVFEVHQKHELKKFTKEITGLRFVHMKNFMFQRCELELVKFLLRRAVNLELMVLTTPKYARREVSASGHKIYDKLVNCKASPKAEIYIFQACSEQCPIEPMHERLWW